MCSDRKPLQGHLNRKENISIYFNKIEGILIKEMLMFVDTRLLSKYMHNKGLYLLYNRVLHVL
jgi:hypothetical protein